MLQNCSADVRHKSVETRKPLRVSIEARAPQASGSAIKRPKSLAAAGAMHARSRLVNVRSCAILDWHPATRHCARSLPIPPDWRASYAPRVRTVRRHLHRQPSCAFALSSHQPGAAMAAEKYPRAGRLQHVRNLTRCAVTARSWCQPTRVVARNGHWFQATGEQTLARWSMPGCYRDRSTGRDRA
jgi:hypothetical protein